MRNGRLWASMLAVTKTVVDNVIFEQESETVVVSVRPARGQRQLCGICRKRCPRYDAGAGRRRWRSVDFGTHKVFLVLSRVKSL